MNNRFYTDSEIEKMHETGEYPDTDLSDEDLDDSDADPNYQEEPETDDMDSDDSMVPVSASTSKLQPKRNRVTSRSPSPQTNTNIANQSLPPQPENNAFDNIVWTDPIGNQRIFQFTGPSGMDPSTSGIFALADPIDYFLLFLTPQVLDKMVNETNLYATQILEKTDAAPRSRIHDWTPTDCQEMTKFIGLLGWMGLVKVPKLADYWRRSELYALPLPKNTMSRNRFELLLRFWHFANNDEAQQHNRLNKIENILQIFKNSFRSTYIPAQKICIDETMIPWRGRL